MAKKWQLVIVDPKHPIWKYIGLLTLALVVMAGVNPAGLVI